VRLSLKILPSTFDVGQQEFSKVLKSEVTVSSVPKMLRDHSAYEGSRD